MFVSLPVIVQTSFQRDERAAFDRFAPLFVIKNLTYGFQCFATQQQAYMFSMRSTTLPIDLADYNVNRWRANSILKTFKYHFVAIRKTELQIFNIFL